MIRTYLDSGVLIAAAKGEPALGAKALQVIEDDKREFISSDAVRLEVLPAPQREGYPDQYTFYEDFFDTQVVDWVPMDRTAADLAIKEASKLDLGALDALHIALAKQGEADELVTTEKPTKPICTTKLVTIRSLLA